MLTIIKLIFLLNCLKQIWGKIFSPMLFTSDPIQTEKFNLIDGIVKTKERPHFFEDPQGLRQKLEERLRKLEQSKTH